MSTRVEQLQQVRTYYHDTHSYYKYTWMGRQSRAMHFGYYGNGATRHQDALDAMNAQMADAAAIQPHDFVVDAGCGFGGSSIWLAREIGCDVTGLNIVPRQIEAAQRYARQDNVHQKTRFRLADFAESGLESGSADVVWALESLVHSDNQPAALHEFVRLLRPGGRMVIGQYFLREKPLNAGEQELIDTWCEGWAMPKLYRTRDFNILLGEAGMTVTGQQDLSHEVRRSFDRMERLLAIERPWGAFVRALGLHSMGRHRHNVASQAGADALKQGLWDYRIVCATK